MPDIRLADAALPLHVSPTADTPFSNSVPSVPDSPGGLLELWQPRFPSPASLGAVAELFDARPAWNGEEGPRHRLVLAAGSFRVTAPNLARREHTAERAVRARRLFADETAPYLVRADKDAKNPTRRALGMPEIEIRWKEAVPQPIPQREVTEWSRKSRANMVAALCEIDYRPLFADPTRLPTMITLTYPGDWLTVAPNGKAVKRHLQAFRRRYAKAWGEDLRAVWKLEFQMRGAPHFHLLMVPPHGLARTPKPRARAAAWVGAGQPFRQWLSAVWANIVNHPDPEQRALHTGAGTNVKWAEGLRCTDPKRVAVYFTKHGSFSAKEYQNRVPEPWQEPGRGPGRFWGYWCLHRVTVGVEVTPEQATQAARLVRRWARAQGTTREAVVWRTRGGAIRSEVAEVQGLAGVDTIECRTARRRKVRRRVVRLKNGRGFVSVNDGPGFAAQIAHALSLPR
jgi:hypothetical protein